MKEILLPFLIYSVMGTILHFTYNLSKKNIVVGMFSSVNESVWEHIKLLLTPIFFYNMFLYVMKYQNNYFIKLLVELLVAIIFIIVLYKIKIVIYKDKKPFINILIFYFTAFICSLVGYLISNYNIPNWINLISIIGVMIIYVMYMVYTVCPPRKSIFKDPITNCYGIDCVNK